MEAPCNSRACCSGMSIVLCGVDDTEAGTSGDGRRQGGRRTCGRRRSLLTHVSTSHWGANVPAFHADDGRRPRASSSTARPPSASSPSPTATSAALIVLGTRAKRWRPSVARRVVKRRATAR